MKLAIILDTDPVPVEEWQNLILSIDSEMKFQVFSKVEEFASWFEELKDNEEAYKDLKVSVLVSSRKLLGQRHASLFEKINLYMKSKGYLDEERDRIPLLITAESASGFKRETYYLEIFDNIIYKPFDEAIAKGKLNWAMNREDALSDEELTKQKPVSPLEMLKNVRIDRVTELGFRTISTEEIPTGRLARYYLPLLKPMGDDYGVFAICTSCRPHGDGEFLCSFSFFGLDTIKIKNIRYLIDGASDTSELELLDEKSKASTGIIVISEFKDLTVRLEGNLDAAFDNKEIVSFPSFAEFYAEIDPEVGLQLWAESLAESRTACVEYTYPSGYFQRAYIVGEEDKDIENYLGLNRGQLVNLRSELLKVLSEEKRPKVSPFFKIDGKEIEPLSLVWPLQNQATYITLEKAELADVELDEGKTEKRLRVYLRPAQAKELTENFKESRLPTNPKLMVISERVAKSRDFEFWKNLGSQLVKEKDKEMEIIVIGKTPLSLYDLAKRYEGFTDYIVDPFEATYLKKRIKQSIPEIAMDEDVPSRLCSHTDENIKVGVQVEVQNFSEVSLSFEYYRELEKNCFREFVIYIQAEKVYEELVAKHVSSEKISDGVVLNHFTLFGHSEDTNQLIREWLYEQYAESKNEKN